MDSSSCSPRRTRRSGPSEASTATITPSDADQQTDHRRDGQPLSLAQCFPLRSLAVARF